MLFDKDSGLDLTVGGAGIEFDVELFLALLYGIMLGDLLNDLASQIRPFEVEPGQADRVMATCLEHLAAVVAAAPPPPRAVLPAVQRLTAP